MKKKYGYNRFTGTDIVINESMRGVVEKLDFTCNSEQPYKNIMIKQGLSTPITDTAFWATGSPNQSATRGAYPQSDGWIRIINTATPTSLQYTNMYITLNAVPSLKPSTVYTIFYQVRNKNFEAGFSSILSLSDGTSDVWTVDPNQFNPANLTENTIYSQVRTTRSDLANATRFLRLFQEYRTTKSVCDYELRIWVVEGDHSANPIPFEMYDPTPEYPKPIYSSGDGGKITVRSGNGTSSSDVDITLPSGYVGGSLPNGVADTATQQKIGKVVLNGSENWSVQVATEYSINKSNFPNCGVGYNQHTKFMCSHFKVVSNAGAVPITNCRVGTNFFNFNYDNGVGGVDNFKTWLASNPITLYYELATPVDITLDIPQIETYEGINTITTTNQVKPNLTIEAWKR